MVFIHCIKRRRENICYENWNIRDKYIKDYYTQYIKPYENNGIITIVTCNI